MTLASGFPLIVLSVLCALTQPDPSEPLAHRSTALARWGDQLVVVGSGGLVLRDGEGHGPLDRLVLPGGCIEVSVSGQRAYASCGPQGLVVVDLPDDAAPVVVARWKSPGAVYQVAETDDGRLLVADGVMGLRILSVAGEPFRELTALDLGAQVRGVVVRGQRAYVAAGRAGVFTVALGEMTLQLLGGTRTVDARELALLPGGHRAVLADGAGGLVLLDLEGEAARILDRITRMGVDRVRGVAVLGELVACAEGSSGVRLVRVTDEGQLEELSRLRELSGEITDALLVGAGAARRAFLAADRAGVFVIDLSDLAHPRLLPAP